jgi:hypothetical protein
MDRRSVQESALTGNRREALFGHRIQDSADQKFTTVFQGQRNTEMGHSVHVIRGAVQGIGDPPVVASLLGGIGQYAVFFSEKLVGAEGVENGLSYRFLAGKIGLRDQIGGAFLVGGHAAQLFQQHGPAPANGPFTYLQIVRHWHVP